MSPARSDSGSSKSRPRVEGVETSGVDVRRSNPVRAESEIEAVEPELEAEVTDKQMFKV